MNDKTKFLRVAVEQANKNNLEFNFFDRIITQESKWKASVVNSVTGAVGFGQLLPPSIADFNDEFGTHYKLGMVKYHPSLNLKISAWYLGTKIPQYLRFYGKPVDEYHQAWAYDAGIGKLVSGIMPDETKKYISLVGAKKKRTFLNINFIKRICVFPLRRLKDIVGIYF